MIVSHSKKFIFIHINKCGGTSMVRALLPYLDLSTDLILGGEGFEKKSEEYMHKFNIYKHSSAIDIKNFVGDEIWDDYYKFAFVRNPWDKILSTYYWFLKTKWAEDGKGGAIRRLPDFEAYVESKYMDEKSCSSFLYSDSDCLVDEIFRFEDLPASFFQACIKIGIENISLPSVNTTKSMRDGHYSKFYTLKMRKIVERRYAQDVINFGYNYEKL